MNTLMPDVHALIQHILLSFAEAAVLSRQSKLIY